jgi:lysophospholipase
MSFLSLQTAAESKVLVIYTGGTIGMLLGQRGYEPEPFYLTSTLRSQSRFHDPLGDSLFSNSNSAEGFREWSSNSGRASPSVTATNLSTAASSPTLLVRSSRPMAYPIDASGVGLPPANKASQSVYEMHVPSLITPRIGKDKRIRYAVLEVG